MQPHPTDIVCLFDTHDRVTFCAESKHVPFPGVEDFAGEWLETAHWPNRPVSFAGKKVAVVGTGSSGVQAITEIAQEAESLHVFHRTPNYVVPSQKSPLDIEKYERLASDLPGLWSEVNQTPAGYLLPVGQLPATDLTPAQQRERMQIQWDFGGLAMNYCFPDQKTDLATNELVSDFVREKIKETVLDAEKFDILEPKDYPIGTRRLAVCNGYYESYNRANVNLVDLKRDQIQKITRTGIQTSDATYEFDVIVSALGFEAFTGPIDAIEIQGVDPDVTIKQLWAAGPSCYLGLMVPNFPNLYFLTGPGSPSVLANFNVHNVYHVDYVAEMMREMERNGHASAQAQVQDHEAYKELTQRYTGDLLRRKVNNYMVHVNEDGSRFFVPFAGGWQTYVDLLTKVAAEGYPGILFN